MIYSEKSKYLWYTDLHMDKVFPWTLLNFMRHIKKENPKGVFLTGDISNGKLLITHLKLLAQHIKCPIYFVLGNHDYHGTSIERQHNNVVELCKQFQNLIWLTNSDLIHLNNEVALIGTEGWYDAQLGNPKWLKYTLDWLLTEEFRKLPSMKGRVELFQELANKSCSFISNALNKALESDAKTIYILTHFPPWKEATRDEGTFLEKYYLPYNVNLRLGSAIEKIMETHKKRNVIVLCGHTHTPEYIRVSRNINCQVGQAKLWSINSQKIYV